LGPSTVGYVSLTAAGPAVAIDSAGSIDTCWLMHVVMLAGAEQAVSSTRVERLIKSMNAVRAGLGLGLLYLGGGCAGVLACRMQRTAARIQLLGCSV